MKDLPTHCVVMVTYNHEKYIRTALDSIFDNDILPDKVILYDDCSTDSTWDIVCEYKKHYKNILECHRNEKNLGIFQNINQAYEAAINTEFDIITDLAGDDYLKKGLFEELNKVVVENNIDYKNEKFIIVTNTEELYPDGTVKVFDNYQLKDEKDLIYYRLIGKLSYREIGLSRNVLKNIQLYRYDLGLWADLLFSLNYETNCDNFYFTPFVSAGYRIGVGTVSKQKQDLILQSRYNVEKLIQENYTLSNKSKVFIKHHMLEFEYSNELNKYNQKFRKTFPILLYIKLYGLKSLTKKIIKYFTKKIIVLHK